MRVTNKLEPSDGPSHAQAKEIVSKIKKDCYDKNLSLSPENSEDGKIKFQEGVLSFESGFSSTFAVKALISGLKRRLLDISWANLCHLFQLSPIIKSKKKLA